MMVVLVMGGHVPARGSVHVVMVVVLIVVMRREIPPHREIPTRRAIHMVVVMVPILMISRAAMPIGDVVRCVWIQRPRSCGG